MDLCEFKATLDYTRMIQSKRETEPTVVAHTLNFSIRKLEMGMIGCREKYMAKGDSSSGFSLRFHREGIQQICGDRILHTFV